VIAMFAAILVLLALPVLDSSKIRGISFKPAAKLLF
jgi:quinol-cytochrome oxidoreductase complex cytochrome b subunit